jgi:SAM-dependent methyltransferase
MSDSARFAFGENWRSFVARVNDRRINLALDSLRRLLQVDDLQGKTFLDIGCGSGLFSLAACLLGARRVVSFDYDPDSVQASLALREKYGLAESAWWIGRGDVLDAAFMDALECADVVYSWGVLHHTGAMWRAVENAAGKVRPGGLLVLALYNHTRMSGLWRHIKRFYNRMPRVIQWLMETAYQGVFVAFYLLTLRNPFKVIRNYAAVSRRGMDFAHDMRDWLGGFPYEYAAPGEVLRRVRVAGGFTLEYLTTVNGQGCNEFTFRRA